MDLPFKPIEHTRPNPYGGKPYVYRRQVDINGITREMAVPTEHVAQEVSRPYFSVLPSVDEVIRPVAEDKN